MKQITASVYDGQAIPSMCAFQRIDQAVEWARKCGGWVAVCKDENVLWFNAAIHTLTPVIKYVARNHGGGEVGVWPHFAPANPQYALRDRGAREVVVIV